MQPDGGPATMIHVRTLGTSRIDAGDARVKPTAARKFALLLHLSAEPGRRVSRAALKDLIFPDRTEQSAQHSLRELVYQLRQAGVHIASDAAGMELAPDAVWCDYAELIERERPDPDQMNAAAGGFLPGYAPAHSEAFSEWYDAYRAHAIFDICKALLREAHRARGVADWGTTERAARACLALDPLNQDATLALAEMLAVGGAKAQAVKLLDDYMAEIGRGTSGDLKVPAAALRRRIREKVPDAYRPIDQLPFLGRDEEMRALHERLQAARAGASQCVVVVGDPGVGKSRLAAELTRLAELDGVQTERVTADPPDVRRPMSAFVDLVPRLLRLPGALGCSPSSMRALERLTKTTPSDDLADSSAYEMEAVANSITTSIGDLVDALSAESPLLLVVEDAHWLDDFSLRTIAEVVQTRAKRRVCVVLTTRDNSRFNSRLRFADQLATVGLRPLDRSAAREITEKVLQGTTGATDPALRNWMVAASLGNPLFLHSIATHYRATGTPFAVPPSLRDLLRRRLDVLSPRATAVMQACVILGKLCTVARVVKCLDVPHIDLVVAFNELDAAHALVVEDQRLTPAHPLIAELVLEGSAETTVRLIHARIASLLADDDTADGSPALLWDCAEHWVAAGEDQRALAILRDCAEHARGMGQAAAAAQTLMRAAALDLDESVRVELLREAVRAASQGIESDVVLAATAELRALAVTTEHDDIELAELLALAGSHWEPPEFYDRALACASATSADPTHRVRAAIALLKYADTLGEPQWSGAITSAIGDAQLSLVDEVLRTEYNTVLHCAFGNQQLAVESARRLRRFGLEAGGPRGAALERNASIALWRGGHVDEALDAARHAYKVAASAGSIWISFLAATEIACIYHDTGDDESSVFWHQEALSASAHRPDLAHGFEGTYFKIEWALIAGDSKYAKSLFDAAVESGIFQDRLATRLSECVELRLRQLHGGRPVATKILAALQTRAFRHFPPSGAPDLEIAVVCAAYCESGRLIAAAELVSRYLQTGRRTAAPVGRILRNVADQYRLSLSTPG